MRRWNWKASRLSHGFPESRIDGRALQGVSQRDHRRSGAVARICETSTAASGAATSSSSALHQTLVHPHSLGMSRSSTKRKTIVTDTEVTREPGDILPARCRDRGILLVLAPPHGLPSAAFDDPVDRSTCPHRRANAAATGVTRG